MQTLFVNAAVDSPVASTSVLLTAHSVLLAGELAFVELLLISFAKAIAAPLSFLQMSSPLECHLVYWMEIGLGVLLSLFFFCLASKYA